MSIGYGVIVPCYILGLLAMCEMLCLDSVSGGYQGPNGTKQIEAKAQFQQDQVAIDTSDCFRGVSCLPAPGEAGMKFWCTPMFWTQQCLPLIEAVASIQRANFDPESQGLPSHNLST